MHGEPGNMARERGDSFQVFLGQYTLEEDIGEGGDGGVWRARGPSENVAVKILKRGRQHSRRRATRGERYRGARTVAEDTWRAFLFWTPIATPSGMQCHLPLHCGRSSDLTQACARSGKRVAALRKALGAGSREVRFPTEISSQIVYFWYDGRWCVGDFGLAELQRDRDDHAE